MAGGGVDEARDLVPDLDRARGGSGCGGGFGPRRATPGPAGEERGGEVAGGRDDKWQRQGLCGAENEE